MMDKERNEREDISEHMARICAAIKRGDFEHNDLIGAWVTVGELIAVIATGAGTDLDTGLRMVGDRAKKAAARLLRKARPTPRDKQADAPIKSALRDDLLIGAQAIADYIGMKPSQIYHLGRAGRLPLTKLDGPEVKGKRTKSHLIARKSELDRALSAYALA